MENQNAQSVLKTFPQNKELKKRSLNTIVVTFVVVLLGISTGYLLSRTTLGSSGTSLNPGSESDSQVKTEETVDLSEFSEEEAPIGILQKGGIDGEGTHRLERPGGPSKSVYLTSTVLDLESYVGKKVQVWGETLSAVKAGWLMDVVKIKEAN